MRRTRWGRSGKRALPGVWVAMWLIALAAGPVWQAQAAPLAPAIARCDPTAISTPYTTNTTFDLYVEDAIDLYGVDLRLSFNTSLAQVVDDDGGAAGVQITPLSGFVAAGYVVKRVADNTAGTIWYAATQLNPTAPVTGSGAVARITLHPLASGTFTMTFTNAQLARQDGSFIPVTVADCLVTFTTPLPTTTAISPASALANSPAFSLTVTGTNFINGSVVRWGGAARPTTYISSTRVIASIPGSDLTTAGPVNVTVFNPAPGGGQSNAQVFTVQTRVHWTAASYSAGEAAGSGVLTATLDAPSAVTVTVGVSTSHGTAGAADYTPLNTTLTFTPGQTSRTVLVPIANDTLDENNETLNVALASPVNALLGTPAIATLTITDNDVPPSAQFSTAAASVSEAAGTAPITVTLSAASGLTVTVPYTTAHGSAGPADYTPAAGTVTFAPGTTTRTISVTVANDTLDEANETFTVALGTPTNATLGTPATTTVTIVDNDAPPSVRFASATYTVTEGTSTAPVTVTLSAASGLTVTVVVTTSNGTAAAGSDYTPVTVTLTFTPGITSRGVSIAILDNAVLEPVETVRLGLSGLVNASPGTPASATLTILDNDAVQFRLYLPLVLK
jgi:hypothetical protein